jgi:hypothetical protein
MYVVASISFAWSSILTNFLILHVYPAYLGVRILICMCIQILVFGAGSHGAVRPRVQ